MNKNIPKKTDGIDYAELLLKKQTVWWKRFLDVQAPYRWNIRRLNPGFVLDIGCGIGRNLMHLKGHGVGIDHNQQSIEFARQRGLQAFMPDEFSSAEFNSPERFDSIIFAHVAEHMLEDEAVHLLGKYLPNLKTGGRLIAITPQEAGYKNDPTHVQFMKFSELRNIASRLNMHLLREYSFPFPRFAGRFFVYNEFISISTKVV